MTDSFYRAFEDKHRGSRELIKSRLEVYLPFIAPLLSLYSAPEILDLGCGRGEWLELLKNHGFQAKGVDLDEGMLLACRELDLDVTQADATEYIKALATDSLCVVSAFHVVEHISFDDLRHLVDEAHRVLKPGGMLILETPNPENLVVGTSSFYLDPTHQRPIPEQLLSFVVEYSGFGRVKALYLQESPSLVTSQKVALVEVFGGVSPDYAVVAQKHASPEISALFDSPFNRLYGVRLSELADRYDHQADVQINEIESKNQWLQNEWDAAQQRVLELSQHMGRMETELAVEQQKAASLTAELGSTNERNAQLQAHDQWLQNEWDAAKAKVDELNHSSHYWWTVADGLNQELQSIYLSKSWRITLPLRKAMLAGKWIMALPARAARLALRQPKHLAKPLVKWGARKIIANPGLKVRALNVLDKHPKLKQHLRLFAMRAGLITNWGAVLPVSQSIVSNPISVKTGEQAQPPIMQESMQKELPTGLSHRAARIYADLQKATRARRS